MVSHGFRGFDRFFYRAGCRIFVVFFVFLMGIVWRILCGRLGIR